MCISTSAQETDSVFFNSAKFDGNDFASFEDIVRKLPGAEVDAEGNILVNGKPINKILVNGEPYYDGDYAFAVTPDKAVYSWASYTGQFNGINDDIWQKEKDLFAVAD